MEQAPPGQWSRPQVARVQEEFGQRSQKYGLIFSPQKRSHSRKKKLELWRGPIAALVPCSQNFVSEA